MNQERLGKLIELAIVFPDEGANTKRATIYPFIACEMLSEPGKIHDKILDDSTLMERIFNFLEDTTVNLTLAGYFSKIVVPIFHRNPARTLQYLDKSGLFQKLVRHIYSKSIADIVLQVITFDPQQPEFFVAERKKVVQFVINELLASEEYQVYFAGQIIIEVIIKALEVNSWKDLLGVISKKENLSVYFNCIASEEKYKIIAGASIIRQLFTIFLGTDLGNDQNREISDLMIEFLPEIKLKLQTPPTSMYLGTFCEEIEPLGEHRLKNIELLIASIKIENEASWNSIAESEILNEIVKLFFKMPWNSILHNTVEVLINNCIYTQHRPLIIAMLITSDFITHMINTAFSPQSTHRLGVLGHISRIGNMLNQSDNEIVKECIENAQRWKEFCSAYLEVRNNYDSKQLGEINLKEKSWSEEEEPQTELCLPPEKMHLFSNYKHIEENRSEIVEDNEKEKQDIEEIGEKISQEDLIGEGKNTSGHGILYVIPNSSNFFETTDSKIKEILEEKTRTSPEPLKKAIISPKNRQISPRFNGKGSFNLSPSHHSEFNNNVFWNIGIRVDEIDDLEEI